MENSTFSPFSASWMTDVVSDKIQKLRLRLLDLGYRNPLLATRFSGRSNSYIRVVDELPDVLFSRLSSQSQFTFKSLPQLEDNPRDEETEEFQNALASAQINDEEYAEILKNLDPSDENAFVEEKEAERTLRDRVREDLGMPLRQKTTDHHSLVQHARNNGISPSYELPVEEERSTDGRHEDDYIQTLLLPEVLERTASRLISKNRSWQQETGINVMQAAFGFLEWEDPENDRRNFSPLILLPVVVEKKRTGRGSVEFCVKGTEDLSEGNKVIAEKLLRDFGIELPRYQTGSSIESYMAEVACLSQTRIKHWRVRRYVAFGVFPSAQLAMYHDLDIERERIHPDHIVGRILGATAGSSSDSSDISLFAEDYEVDTPRIESQVSVLVDNADSSQFSAMVDVAGGKNIAVEGPPGTGKSQTIVNTIAAALADGKKVLFVAEKMAALEVVRSRLNRLKLGEFLLSLQAKRSSREEVIKSVRERLRAEENTKGLLNYETKKKELYEARDKIGEYIKLMSREYRNTGLTVHQIIGLQVTKHDILEELRRDIWTSDSLPIEVNEERIRDIKHTADRLENAWDRVKNTTPRRWLGVSLQAWDRYALEEVLGDVADVASLYRNVNELALKLSVFGLGDCGDVESVKAFSGKSKKLEKSMPATEVGLVTSLIGDQESSSGIGELLKHRKRCLELFEDLKEVFNDPLEEDLPSRLRKVSATCKRQNFDKLDPATMEKELECCRRLVSEHKKTEKKAKDLLDKMPFVSKWTINMLESVKQMISEVEPDVFLHRHPNVADPRQRHFIKRDIEIGVALKEEKDKLENLFSMEELLDSEGISSLMTVIGAAGFFSFLSSNYRKAKRSYMMLSKTDGFERGAAVRNLARLSKWTEDRDDFLGNERMKDTFREFFMGVETDFETLKKLVDFYERVERKFAGNLEIRDFLNTEERNTLLFLNSVETLDVEDKEKTFSELLDIADERQAKFERMREDVELVKQLSGCLRRDPRDTSADDLLELADQLEEQRLLRKTSENSRLWERFGDCLEKAGSDFQTIEKSISVAEAISECAQWTEIFRKLITENGVSEAVELTEDFLAKLQEAENATRHLTEKTGINWKESFPSEDYRAIAEHLENISENRKELTDEAGYSRAYEEIERGGMGQLVTDLLASGRGLKNLGEILEARIVEILSISIRREYPSIQEYSGQRLNTLRKRFAELDKNVVESSRQYLRNKLIEKANPPQGNGKGKKSTWTEFALLSNEIQKKRRHIPLRDLIRRAGSALLELKPCWMMSPLAVAQYIERDGINFDLCIIDEASQMTPENAIGALMRTKQVMIVGDTNQLPPTNFFRKMIDDEDDEEAVSEESVLELANQAFRPARRLRWHYRSRDESLIRFSNRMVYDDDLVTFPSPGGERKDMGVSFEKVEGEYKSGDNLPEAEAVVDSAIRFMNDYPHRSLGIVTLNKKQCDLIEARFQYAINNNPKVMKYVEHWESCGEGLESFFVKNLENVQGDERDVIFISTVYGPERPGGRVYQRFGPINGVAGKRRLNVLFTRAREKIVTFSSMNATDISAEENQNPGVNMMRRWLEYSATGMLDSGDIAQGPYCEPDSDFEAYVAKQIVAMGCEPVSQVGVGRYRIDIGVRHPSWPHGFLLGVECDGATYHSSKSARERDRYRQEVLENLGWCIHRIWSTDWFDDPRAEAQKLRNRIREILEKKNRELKDKKPVSSDATSFVESSGPMSVQNGPRFLVVNSEPTSFVEPSEGGEESSQGTMRSVDREEFSEIKGTTDETEIGIGDEVQFRYLTGGQEEKKIYITDEEIDSNDCYSVHINQPLGYALLGAELNEEIEVLVGNQIQRVKIEKIVKPVKRM